MEYDYVNQAWIKDGKYVRCGHQTDCNCYGRIHEGQKATVIDKIGGTWEIEKK